MYFFQKKVRLFYSNVAHLISNMNQTSIRISGYEDLIHGNLHYIGIGSRRVRGRPY